MSNSTLRRLASTCTSFITGKAPLPVPTNETTTLPRMPIRIDGISYDHDVVIDRGEVRERKKRASKKFREAFGHAPLSLEEGCLSCAPKSPDF